MFLFKQRWLSGSYCRDSNDDNRICTEHSSEGEICDNDYECHPYLVCGADNKCIKKFSLENGQETQRKLACKSGVSAYLGGKNVCANLIVTNECSAEESCTLQYEYNRDTLEEETECKYNGKEQLTCDFQDGSSEMLKYIELYTKQINELDEEDLKGIENYETLDSEDINIHT